MHCFNENSKLDLNLYFIYCREKLRKMDKTDNIIDDCVEKFTKELIAEGKRIIFRFCLKSPLKYRDQYGILREFAPTIST